MQRARVITLPNGSSPFIIDGRMIIGNLPQGISLNVSSPVLVQGQDFQSSTLRQFSFTLSSQINEDDYHTIRAKIDAMDDALGLRNKRFYLYGDRYWLVRSEGMFINILYPQVRDSLISLDLYFLVLNPFLKDSDGNLYRCW